MRRRQSYFKRLPEAPACLGLTQSRRIRFGEVDAMAVTWHGHYAVLFEESSTELRRRCGLTYKAFFEAQVQAPIVQLHVDYFRPLVLDELCRVTVLMVWTDAARLNMEYRVIKQDDQLAATGYTVQMFVDARQQIPYITAPKLWQTCLDRWAGGGFKDLIHEDGRG